MTTYKLPVASTLTYFIRSSSLPRSLIIDRVGFFGSLQIGYTIKKNSSRWKRLWRCLSNKMIIFHFDMIVSRYFKFVICIYSIPLISVIIILIHHEKPDVVTRSTRCHRCVRRLSSISLRNMRRQSYQLSWISLFRVHFFVLRIRYTAWENHLCPFRAPVHRRRSANLLWSIPFFNIRLVQRGYLWWCRLRISIDLLFRIVSSSISFHWRCNDARHGIVYASPTTLDVSESSADSLPHFANWSMQFPHLVQVTESQRETAQTRSVDRILLLFHVNRNDDDWTSLKVIHFWAYDCRYSKRIVFLQKWWKIKCQWSTAWLLYVFSLLVFFFSFLRDVLLCDFFEFEYFVVFCLRPSDPCANLVVVPQMENVVRLTSEFFILFVSSPADSWETWIHCSSKWIFLLSSFPRDSRTTARKMLATSSSL